MGRIWPTRMYRNAFKAYRSVEFERHYRLAWAEFEREMKPKRGPFKRITRWWQGHSKQKPGAYTP